MIGKRWCLSLAVGMMVCTALGWLIVRWHSPELILDGKPETFWINSLPGNSKQLYDLGSNAVPVLLKAVDLRQDPITRGYRKLWPKMPNWVKRLWPRPVDAAMVRLTATGLLTQVGNSKIFIRVLTENADPEVRLRVIRQLTVNSEKAVTLALTQALEDKDSRVRGAALLGLSLTDRDHGPAIPALIKCLRDNNPGMRQWAVMTLCMDSSGFEAALPELKLALKDPDKRVRDAVAEGFRNWGPRDVH